MMTGNEARRVARSALVVHHPRRPHALLDWVNGVVLGALVTAIVLGVAFAAYVDRHKGDTLSHGSECIGALIRGDR